jgi:hypothetical protein
VEVKDSELAGTCSFKAEFPACTTMVVKNQVIEHAYSNSDSLYVVMTFLGFIMHIMDLILVSYK